VHLLDAPVSGGVQRAREGKLSVIVSGDEAAFTRVAGLLESIGKVHYMGARSGQAQMMKLVNNLLSQISTAATYEAFVLGAKAGLDPDATTATPGTTTATPGATTAAPGATPATPGSTTGATGAATGAATAAGGSATSGAAKGAAGRASAGRGR
jgi:3-hydroxyisobutyrate dehydrogenase-like beta-hydroxyacid dehydrogenase